MSILSWGSDHYGDSRDDAYNKGFDDAYNGRDYGGSNAGGGDDYDQGYEWGVGER
jgi:hypothetical protein